VDNEDFFVLDVRLPSNGFGDGVGVACKFEEGKADLWQALV
jgi:hypothetical protein